MRLVFRNARIALPGGGTVDGDLACRDGLIENVQTVSGNGDEEVEAGGKLLMPGVIDAQVHFRDPGATHKEDLGSGSRAAVRGGVTSFLEMPNTNPPTVNQDALNAKLKTAAQKCVANYGFFIGATPDNLEDINTASPVCGIKVFMGSSTGSLLVDDERDLEKIFANGERLIAVHAEDEQRIRRRMARFKKDHAGKKMPPRLHSEIRDEACAEAATEKILALSQKYGRRLHILHLSTAGEVARLRGNKPPWVSAEAVPNHLLLNTADYEAQGTLVQMNPPLREAFHNGELWRGLKDGVLDIIATDHAPHTLEEKSRPYPDSPSGTPGVETSLPLMLTEMANRRCNLGDILRWMCEGPARLYRIANKGRIEPGMDADLVLVNTDDYKLLTDADTFTRANWSPFSGRSLTGWPVYTVVGGRIAYDNGAIRPGARGAALQFN